MGWELREFSEGIYERGRISAVGSLPMGTQTYRVVLKQDEDKWYVAQCVEVPSAISQGKTREDALKNIKEAIELLLEHRASKVAGQRVEEVLVRV